MRKPRDYDSELKALETKARQLKARRQSQLGELVIASGADVLSPEELAGALLAAAATSDRATKEAWRKSGVALFSDARTKPASSASRDHSGAAQNEGSAPSSRSEPGAA